MPVDEISILVKPSLVTAVTDSRAPTAVAAMQRADALLRQMTIEEKAMQLSSVFPLALFDTKGATTASSTRCSSTALGMCPHSA